MSGADQIGLELRDHHERVTVSARGESFAETGPGAIRSRRAVVGEDVGGVDPEWLEGDASCGEVFLVGHRLRQWGAPVMNRLGRVGESLALSRLGKREAGGG